MADPAAAYYPHHHLSSQPYYPYYEHPALPPGASQQPPPPGLHPQYYPGQHQEQPPPPPPPYGATYPYAPLQLSGGDEVRTLFIAGLPDDVKSREIYNLFREFPGYDSCQVRCTGQSTQAFAFAVFSDQQSALAAMHTLNGMVFDLEKESTLFIDLAKSNSRSKRQRTDDGLLYTSDKKVRGAGGYSRGLPEAGVGGNIHMPGMGNSAHNGYPSTQSHMKLNFEAMSALDPDKSQSNSSNTAPCPTLFVGNLVPTCSETELIQVFSRCRGFLKLKMQNKNGVPVAFVDFQDVVCSSEALNHLQGTLLYSSDGEGMRLEYAKTRMGLRKRERAS